MYITQYNIILYYIIKFSICVSMCLCKVHACMHTYVHRIYIHMNDRLRALIHRTWTYHGADQWD